MKEKLRRKVICKKFFSKFFPFLTLSDYYKNNQILLPRKLKNILPTLAKTNVGIFSSSYLFYISFFLRIKAASDDTTNRDTAISNISLTPVFGVSSFGGSGVFIGSSFA